MSGDSSQVDKTVLAAEEKDEFQEELNGAADLLKEVGLEEPIEAPKKASVGIRAEVGPTAVVIGDAHNEPGLSIERFKWLGRLIAKVEPELVVIIGDWWSFDSLGRFDAPGSAQFSRQSYWADLRSGIAALQLLKKTIVEERGEAWYENLEKVFTWGNHEQRLHKANEADVRHLGVFSPEHLRLEHFGFHQVGYGEWYPWNGFYFTHNAEARSKEYPAAWYAKNRGVSAVWGHTHQFDTYLRRQVGPVLRQAQPINVACYYEHDMTYVQAFKNWEPNRGIVVMHDCHEGRCDVEFWGLARMRGTFG